MGAHVTLQGCAAGRRLEPKADFPPGLNVYKYSNIKACQHTFPLIHILSSYGDHPGESLLHPPRRPFHLMSPSALLVGRRPLRSPHLCSSLLLGRRHPQSNFFLVVQRFVVLSQPSSQRAEVDNPDRTTAGFAGALISYVIVCQSVFSARSFARLLTHIPGNPLA